METWHLYRSFQVEVGTGKPGYRWAQGWAQALLSGCSQTLTLHHWRAMAKRDGAKTKIHVSERKACEAVAKAIKE